MRYKIFLPFYLIIFTSLLFSQPEIEEISKLKAFYKPGDAVDFKVEFSEDVSGMLLTIEYYHLNEFLETDQITLSGDEAAWNWQPPADNYRGYLMLAVLKSAGQAIDTANIAVDVSSDWKMFPRYGFISKYDYMLQGQIDYVLDKLNRHHINGLQFYDWHWKHHMPLKGEPGNVSSTWPDIANRTIYLSTVEGYIAGAKARNMKTMAYNLVYGAYENASQDGVSTQWRMFNDQSHQSPDYHDLPSSWASDIYIMDFSNILWQNYIMEQSAKVFEALDFDGWHMDQLGDRGLKYKYGGENIYVQETFEPFIKKAGMQLDVPVVCNAVNQYGQKFIAGGGVEFLYTEVWDPNDEYRDLTNVINLNNFYGENKLKTVLAAYVNEGKSGSTGYFNKNSVLFADAVIFASGGSHLEIGEHMLANPYFPNSNLGMTLTLREKVQNYYDFMVAYENLLRDGIEGYDIDISSDNHSVVTWPPQQGSIWAFPRARRDNLVLHVINFTQAATMLWRDNAGIQTEPDLLENVELKFETDKTVEKIWYSSADNDYLTPEEIEWTQNGSNVSLVLPKLKYWSMVVVELDEVITGVDKDDEMPQGYNLYQNYPNPFNPETTISFSLPEKTEVALNIYNLLGEKVSFIPGREYSTGEHSVNFNSGDLASGVYIYHLQAGPFSESRKMLILK